jgi:hypothetical protein
MDGLWIAQFTGSAQHGAGVVVFNGDSVLGGDGGYYYSGKLDRSGDFFTTTLTVAPHSPAYQSVFGTTGHTLHLKLSGQLQPGGTSIIATGHPVEMPAAKFQVALTKRAV